MITLKDIQALEDAIVEIEWVIEDTKAAIREAAEEGGDAVAYEKDLQWAEGVLEELKDELHHANYRFDNGI